MNNEINVYCDESCHLENDGQKCMVLGCIIIDKDKMKAVSNEIKEIKVKFCGRRFTEIKWTKVSPNKLGMYLELINLFVENTNLRFRGVLIPDKQLLSHEAFDQTNDDFYYKMFYLALNHVIGAENKYNVYFDLKDKYEMQKVRVIKQCLINKNHYSGSNLDLQLVHSFESQLIQLADLLIGAVGYKARGIYTSEAKKAVIDMLEKGLGKDISQTSLMSYQKFNILRWNSSKAPCI